VKFKEKFRSLDFFASFFYQRKNEDGIIEVIAPNGRSNNENL
jgi:hypothetical protein